MSDYQRGGDWCIGSDGLWYPPTIPELLEPPTGPPAMIAPPPPGYVSQPPPKRRWMPTVLATLLLLVLGLGAVVASTLLSDDKAETITPATASATDHEASPTTEPELTKTQAEVDALMADFTGAASAAIQAEGGESYYSIFSAMHDKFEDLAIDAENIDLDGVELDASRAIGAISGYLAAGSACEIAGEGCARMYGKSIEGYATEALELLGPHSSLGAQMFINEL